MDLGQGLYVTVMGMGIVFLALALLLFAMKALDRLFPARAETPGRAETPARAEKVESVQRSVERAAGAAPGPGAPVATAAGAFEAAVAGRRFAVEVGEGSDGGRRVVVDGESHQVLVDGTVGGKVVIDGRPYHAEVLEVRSDLVTVRVDGSTFAVELPRAEAAVGSPGAEAPPLQDGRPAAQSEPAEGEPVPAPLPGKVLRVAVVAGDSVERGQELCVLEAMKMENSIRSPRQGVVREVRAAAGQSVSAGEPLMILGGTD